MHMEYCMHNAHVNELCSLSCINLSFVSLIYSTPIEKLRRGEEKSFSCPTIINADCKNFKNVIKDKNALDSQGDDFM